MNAKDIELFKNLAEWDFGDAYFDLHNNFECRQITFEKDVLHFTFNALPKTSPPQICLAFQGALLSRFDLRLDEPAASLTLDNLHRGRYEVDGELFDCIGNRSYFYVEFYEGPTAEFWCERVELTIPELRVDPS